MKKRRIDCLFIQAPFIAQGFLPPPENYVSCEGILSMASFLDKNGFSSEVYFSDEVYIRKGSRVFTGEKIHFPLSKIKDQVRRFNPRIVAVTGLTPQYPVSLKILQAAKSADKDIVTVIGGPHVTYEDKKVFENSKNVDIVVRGEGEWTMLDIVKSVTGGKDLDDVSGITFKKGSKIIRNEDRPLGDLSQLPPVDYSKADPEYLKECDFFLTFTRGCPFNCSYCVEGKFWGNNVRTRSVDAVFSEMEYLNSNFNSKSKNNIFFLGSVFNSPRDFFVRICKKMKKIDFGDKSVKVLLSAAYLSEEDVRIMIEAGITKGTIAAESAAPEVLKRMNKRITFDMVVEKCKLMRKHGLEVGTFWLLGHPGETEETVQTSLDAMLHLWTEGLNQTQEVAFFIPYPGTPISLDPEKEGYKIMVDDLSKHGRYDKPIIELKDIPYERMCQIHKEAREINQNWTSFCQERSLKKNMEQIEKILSSLSKKESF